MQSVRKKQNNSFSESWKHTKKKKKNREKLINKQKTNVDLTYFYDVFVVAMLFPTDRIICSDAKSSFLLLLAMDHCETFG